jgi:hypothetical protein
MDLKHQGKRHPILFVLLVLKLNRKKPVGSFPDRHSTEIICTLLLRLFRSRVAVSQKRFLDSLFTAVAIVVLLLAAPVIGIELGRLLGTTLP